MHTAVVIKSNPKHNKNNGKYQQTRDLDKRAAHFAQRIIKNVIFSYKFIIFLPRIILRDLTLYIIALLPELAVSSQPIC